jgi:hypothetical protein
VPRFAALWRFVLLAGLSPACILYTDPINRPPSVTIVAPDVIHPNEMVAFKAQVSDPDGDATHVRWFYVAKGCQGITAEEWARNRKSFEETFDLEVRGHETFCVRLEAEDKHGAVAAAKDFEGTPQNRLPDADLMVEPQKGTAGYALFTDFRLRALPSVDADGDPVTFTWKGQKPGGGEMTLDACDGTRPDERCFAADQPGSYTITVEASDGFSGGRGKPRMVSLPVLDDLPPSIEATSPSKDTGVIVLPPLETHDFEVLRVSDDGNPFPAGPHGTTTFHWFTGATLDSLRHWIGHDSPTFPVSAALFDDARSGSTIFVRVEARDPKREEPGELRALEDACRGREICELPAGTVRWVTWRVRLQ